MKGDFSSENEGRRAPILVNQWLGMPSDVRQYKWIFNREEIQQKCKILTTCIKQHVLLPLNPDIWVFGFGWKQTFRFLHIEGSVKPFSQVTTTGADERKSTESPPWSSICLQSVRGWKRFTDYFSWGKERERENNLIQEIPRQTKTELPKWRRDPRGSLFGTSLRIMTLLW